jgi:sugar phosphate isomerase/epimerase
VNVTAWSNGLEVTGGGTGIVSHAGLGLLRRLADKTGLTVSVSVPLTPFPLTPGQATRRIAAGHGHGGY